MYLIVGLGNPGEQFISTRHNAGFDVLVSFAKEHKTALSFKKKYDSIMGELTIGGEKIVLLLPQTFMNNSGKAVSSILKMREISIENTIVIHDELDLPLGTVRIKKGGGAGGHNGLKSIIDETGSNDFIRVRVGIGRPEKGIGDRGQGIGKGTQSTEHRARSTDGGGQGAGAEYVLSKVPKSDMKEFTSSIETAAKALDEIILNGCSAAMNTFNRSL